MPDCDWCGEAVGGEAAFSCNYCEDTHCGDHRLPENHGCIAVKASDTLGPDLVNFLYQSRDTKDGDGNPEPEPVTERAEEPGDDCPRCGASAPKGFTYCTECRDHLSEAEAAVDLTANEERPEPDNEEPEESVDDEGPSTYGPQVECERCTKPIPEGKEYCNSCKRAVYNETWGEGGNTGGGQEGEDSDGDEGDALDLVLGVLLIPFFGVVRVGRGVVAAVGVLYDIRVAMVLFVGVPAVLVGAIGAGVIGADDVSGTPAEPLVSGIDDTIGNAAAGERQFNHTKTERMIFEKTNEVREERGLPPLQWNDRAAGVARTHTGDMAEHQYVGHTNSEGVGQRERYAFCRGGENAAQTYFDETFTTQSGEPTTHTDADDVATGTVRQWMDSDRHREDGLLGPWSSAGVGIAVNGNEVYVVMGFCYA